MPGTFPLHLNAGQSLNCTYSADLPDKTTRANTARAVSDGTNNVKNGTGTASVDFPNASIINVNDSITVDDSYAGAGSPWTISYDGYNKYSRTFACGDTRTVENTATIKELDKSDSASVKINCYNLKVSKDASTSYTKTYTWIIDKTARTNTATAALQNYDSSGGKTKNGITDFSGTAAVDFTNATVTLVDESIDLSESLQGPLGTAADAPKTVTYSRNVGPYESCGNTRSTTPLPS